MFANKITLERFMFPIASKAVKDKLSSQNLTDECIKSLLIEHEGGYLWYIITFCDGTKWKVFDQGDIFCDTLNCEEKKIQCNC